MLECYFSFCSELIRSCPVVFQKLEEVRSHGIGNVYDFRIRIYDKNVFDHELYNFISLINQVESKMN